MRKPELSVGGFSLAAEFISHMVWMSTADRMVEYLNTHATDYAGLPARKLLEWGWILLVHPSDLERVRLTRDLVARTEASVRTEFRLRRFDGQYRWHAISTPVPSLMTTERSSSGSVPPLTSRTERAMTPTSTSLIVGPRKP